MNPKYPFYIVSKGRWESRLTAKTLERLGVPYRIVVEQQEYNNYAAVIHPDKILVLPEHYLNNYDTCDTLGRTKSAGSGAARNYVWDHAEMTGAEKHWVLDDNVHEFHRLNRNRKIRVASGTIFRAAEDFVDRYTNVPLAGFNHRFFIDKSAKRPPFHLNTRIYSVLLIDHKCKYRWRGRYNEDTDLSLR